MAQIILAHEKSFRIGPLEVRPATRTLVRDAVETVVEPRVMQVLVALARAGGNVVSRDDLVESCWEGRVVGDDAINRVLSRLRMLEREAGADVFRIETITRVGYRLVAPELEPNPEAPPAPVSATAAPQPAAPAHAPGRRAVLAGGGAVLALAAGGGLWWGLKARNPLSPAAQAAMDRGRLAMRETLPDETTSAIAAFRQATELAPNVAEPWGQLALAYHQQLQLSGAKSPADAGLVESRAQAAIAHALAIDPDNADAQVARATLEPAYLHWIEKDKVCRALLARYPAHGLLNRLYGILLVETGLFTAAVACFRKALAAEAL